MTTENVTPLVVDDTMASLRERVAFLEQLVEALARQLVAALDANNQMKAARAKSTTAEPPIHTAIRKSGPVSMCRPLGAAPPG